MLPSGTREIEAQLWFYGISGTGVHVPNQQEDAVFYDAQIHVDAILGYPWPLSRGLGVVPSRTGAYLWSPTTNGLNAYLRPWQRNMSMGLQTRQGNVKLQVQEWDAMDGDLSLQKLQLTLPDQFEDQEESDQEGRSMEVWPREERLT